MASDGLSNRQIGDRLFRSPHGQLAPVPVLSQARGRRPPPATRRDRPRQHANHSTRKHRKRDPSIGLLLVSPRPGKRARPRPRNLVPRLRRRRAGYRGSRHGRAGPSQGNGYSMEVPQLAWIPAELAGTCRDGDLRQ